MALSMHIESAFYIAFSLNNNRCKNVVHLFTVQRQRQQQRNQIKSNRINSQRFERNPFETRQGGFQIIQCVC